MPAVTPRGQLQPVEDGCQIGINGLVGRSERLGCLTSFAEGDELTLAGPEIVPGHERLGWSVTRRQIGRG